MAKSGVKKKKAAKAKGFPPEKAAELYKRLANERPDPRTELVYRNPYTLVVAVALSAQATDASVNKATKELFKVADTPAKMVKLGEAGLADHIKTIGLWRNKAKNVIALSKLILEKHGGKTPSTREELEALPGVGRKTANVVASNAFGIPAIAVDTHVFRVSNRIGLAHASNVEKTEEQLQKAIPREDWTAAHHWLIYHGRQICDARKPKCELCPLSGLCEFYRKGTGKR